MEENNKPRTVRQRLQKIAQDFDSAGFGGKRASVHAEHGRKPITLHERVVEVAENFDNNGFGGKRASVHAEHGKSSENDTMAKKKPTQKRAISRQPTEYQKFVSEHRRGGKSLKEISTMWKEKKAGGAMIVNSSLGNSAAAASSGIAGPKENIPGVKVGSYGVSSNSDLKLIVGNGKRAPHVCCDTCTECITKMKELEKKKKKKKKVKFTKDFSLEEKVMNEQLPSINQMRGLIKVKGEKYGLVDKKLDEAIDKNKAIQLSKMSRDGELPSIDEYRIKIKEQKERLGIDDRNKDIKEIKKLVKNAASKEELETIVANAGLTSYNGNDFISQEELDREAELKEEVVRTRIKQIDDEAGDEIIEEVFQELNNNRINIEEINDGYRVIENQIRRVRNDIMNAENDLVRPSYEREKIAISSRIKQLKSQEKSLADQAKILSNQLKEAKNYNDKIYEERYDLIKKGVEAEKKALKEIRERQKDEMRRKVAVVEKSSGFKDYNLLASKAGEVLPGVWESGVSVVKSGIKKIFGYSDAPEIEANPVNPAINEDVFVFEEEPEHFPENEPEVNINEIQGFNPPVNVIPGEGSYDEQVANEFFKKQIEDQNAIDKMLADQEEVRKRENTRQLLKSASHAEQKEEQEEKAERGEEDFINSMKAKIRDSLFSGQSKNSIKNRFDKNEEVYEAARENFLKNNPQLLVPETFDDLIRKIATVTEVPREYDREELHQEVKKYFNEVEEAIKEERKIMDNINNGNFADEVKQMIDDNKINMEDINKMAEANTPEKRRSLEGVFTKFLKGLKAGPAKPYNLSDTKIALGRKYAHKIAEKYLAEKEWRFPDPPIIIEQRDPDPELGSELDPGTDSGTESETESETELESEPSVEGIVDTKMIEESITNIYEILREITNAGSSNFKEKDFEDLTALKERLDNIKTLNELDDVAVEAKKIYDRISISSLKENSDYIRPKTGEDGKVKYFTGPKYKGDSIVNFIEATKNKYRNKDTGSIDLENFKPLLDTYMDEYRGLIVKKSSSHKSKEKDHIIKKMDDVFLDIKNNLKNNKITPAEAYDRMRERYNKTNKIFDDLQKQKNKATIKKQQEAKEAQKSGSKTKAEQKSGSKTKAEQKSGSKTKAEQESGSPSKGKQTPKKSKKKK